MAVTERIRSIGILPVCETESMPMDGRAYVVRFLF
jgi:hypothetical protein